MSAPTRTTIALAILLPATLSAQEASPAPYTFERQIHARWLHGREQPAFTEFDESHHWIRLDSVVPAVPAVPRTLYLTLDAPGRDPARVTLDAAGRVTAIEAELRPRRSPSYRSAEERARFERRRLFENYRRTRLLLPEARVWGLVPTFHPERVERGARWVDTLRLVAERDGFRQALGGTRVSTIAGDTVVAGRRLWIIEDSAAVRYEERSLVDERTLDTLAVVEREAAGTIRGRHLYDPALGLYRVRHDTTALSGTAVLRYPDGRVFRTPARFERTRRVDLYEPAEYEARRTALREARRDRSGGMLILPSTELEERLVAGDALLRDSLEGVMRRSVSPEERARTRRLLTTWGDRSGDFRRRLPRLMLELGDTAWAVRELRDDFVSGRRPIDRETLLFLLPFMADPGLAFAYGLTRDWFYLNAVEGLLRNPPAVTADAGSWPCTLEVCRLLARQWETAMEPRLRDVGLVAHLVLEPALWADTVLARADAGSVLLQPAARLVRGVGATWRAASKAPLPEPGAGWRAWTEWMNGRAPGYPETDDWQPVRFDAGHATAIRFRQAITGRDVVAELRAELRAAASDSARLVYGALLLGLGELRPEPDSVARWLGSGSPALRHLALRALPRLFVRSRPADPATSATLIDRLLAVVIAGEEPWPELAPGREGRGGGLRRIAGGQEAPAPVFILSDGLPAAVRERWRGRATLLTQDEWGARSNRLPGIVFTPDPVEVAGGFARLGVDYSVRVARRQDQTPTGYAGGFTVYLLETADGWRVVRVGGWIT